MFTKMKKTTMPSKARMVFQNTVINQKLKTKIHGHVFFLSHHREEESLTCCNKFIFIEFLFASKSMLDIRTEERV